MNNTVTTRVFRSGNSQAVRLPKAFRIASSTVTLEKTPEGILIRDDSDRKRRARAFARLAGSCPNFPDIAPNAAPSVSRDLE